jgi:hypothetical protein
MSVNLSEIGQYTGTEKYYRHPLMRGKRGQSVYYTDGIHYLENNGAAWLVDLVMSYHIDSKLDKVDFELWTLKVDDTKGVVTCQEDTGSPVLIRQEIEYTDFPIKEFTMYVERGSVDGINPCKVFMLPSER